MSSPAEAYLALCKEQLRNFPREQGIQTEGNNYEGIFGPKVGHYGDDEEEDPQRELLQEGLDLIRSLVQNLNNGPMFAAGTGAPPVADQLVDVLIREREEARAGLEKLKKERPLEPIIRAGGSIFAPDEDERGTSNSP